MSVEVKPSHHPRPAVRDPVVRQCIREASVLIERTKRDAEKELAPEILAAYLVGSRRLDIVEILSLVDVAVSEKDGSEGDNDVDNVFIDYWKIHSGAVKSFTKLVADALPPRHLIISGLVADGTRRYEFEYQYT